MRKFSHARLIGFIGFVLIGISASAASTPTPSAPLGMVVEANNTHTGVDSTNTGATIYDGDHLVTQDDGTMRLRLGLGQMFLHQRTSVRVHAFPNGFSADLDNGTVSAASSEGQTFQLIVDGVSIRPASSHATSAQIAKLGPTEAILISTRGDLQVTLGDEVKTVSAGTSYKLEVESEARALGSDQQGPQPAGRNRNRLLLIAITATVATTGVLAWRALVSPIAP